MLTEILPIIGAFILSMGCGHVLHSNSTEILQEETIV